MYIKREISDLVESWLFRGKVIVIYGPRQVGKTTFCKEILKKQSISLEGHYFDCELHEIRLPLEERELTRLTRMFANKRLIVLDEAQKVADIGVVLKILHDHLPDLQIIATGSSSFELASKISEPLTGRGLEFILYPLSCNELLQRYEVYKFEPLLQQLLVFGSYPEIFLSSESETKILLQDLTNKYLYKDVLESERVKKPNLLIKILQLLAFQVGCEVSQHELAVNLQTSSQTVERYLDLLEKCFVIFRLRPLSRNLRKEISKKDKIYFYDLGIRNSIINQYNSLTLRNDVGQLWENFCIVERIKYRKRNNIIGNIYYWRTHDQKEIDLVEEQDGRFDAYEFKWQQDKVKQPHEFFTTYKDSSFKVITNKNFYDFLLDE